VPLSVGGAGFRSKTMWPGPRPTSIPWSIQPFGYNTPTSQTRQRGQDRQRSDIIGRTVSQTVAQKMIMTDHSSTGIGGMSHFLQRAQCSHCKRCISYSNSVCLSVRPSVCPSVRLSVTRRYCVKTTARSTVQFAPLDSKMCLVL